MRGDGDGNEWERAQSEHAGHVCTKRRKKIYCRFEKGDAFFAANFFSV